MKKKLILASGSLRRRNLLSHIGFQFRVKKPTNHEYMKPGEKPRDVVLRLAKEKAINVSVRLRVSRPTVVIAADTIVVSPNRKILGKPKNGSDAIRMIRTLSGKTHKVYTGYHIVELNRNGVVVRAKARAIWSSVKIRPLSNFQVRNYLKLGESMDKAGAYAAQGKGMAIVESIRGSYTNVVGLPLSEVQTDLKSFGVSASES